MADFNLKVEGEIAILEFNQPDSPVNIIKSETMAEFNGVLDRLEGELKEKVKALLITSPKKGIFIAGANIKEIEGITSEEEAIKKADEGKAIIDRLERIPQKTIAVINGACLGGGLELSLACDYRVAGFDPKIKIGLPEVKLGILPGFGGCIRLPKLIGLQKALMMILPGKMVDGKTAFRYGLVDRLFPDVNLEKETVQFAKDILAGKAKVSRSKKKSFLNWFLEETPIGHCLVFSQAKKNVLRQTKGHYPAPLQAIETIRKCYGKSLQVANKIESEGFGKLGATEVSKNLIKVFYLDEKFRKVNWLDKDVKAKPISKCGVIGAGIMGGGIAQLLSYREIPSRLKDINHDALALALRTAKKVYGSLLKKRRLKKPDVERKMNLISPTVDYSGFKTCDIVIEAVVENMDIKKKVFEELDKETNSSAILVSNTSSLSIKEMASNASRKDKVAGFHFFNPVHRMPLLEVIKTDETSDETLETTVAFARKLGKMVIVVKDEIGFVVNRILLPYMNEAAYLLEEGVPMLHLDRLVKKFGMPMGPMELADEVGIDVGYKVAKILEDRYGDRMKVASILSEIYETKMFGKKTGKGFYLWDGKKKTINGEIESKIKAKGGRSDLNDEIIVKRLIYMMINEASRILEEGVADRPGTIDVGMIYGTGFPPFRAGLLRYADAVGIQNIVDNLNIFEQRTKAGRFVPSNLLIEMAKDGKTFYSE